MSPYDSRLRLPFATTTQFLGLSAIVLAVWLLSPVETKAQVEKAEVNWNFGRGDRLQSGVASTALPDDLEVLWKFQAKEGIEGPAAIIGDTVYVGSFDENLYALDLENGKVRWTYAMGPTKAAPSYYRGKVYIGDENGVVHCVDAKTGKFQWKFETKGEITASANFKDDRLFIGSYDSTLYCLSLEGKKLWEVVTDGPVNGSPAVVGDRTFVAGCDSILHIIDVKTGKELGKVDLGGQAAATAAIFGDGLYVGTMTDQVLGIDWKNAKILWTFEPKRRSLPFFASAAVNNDIVVTGSRNRKIYGLDRQTGKQLWEFETDGRVDPSPVIVGSRVYAPSLDGKLYVLSIKDGKKLREFALGRAIAASPAVGQGRLVLGTTDGVLYCLGQKK